MDRENLWQKFLQTGKVNDYLNYKKDEENEVAEDELLNEGGGGENP